MKNETILFFRRLVFFFGLIENVLIILQCNAKQKGIEISSKGKAKRKKNQQQKKNIACKQKISQHENFHSHFRKFPINFKVIPKVARNSSYFSLARETQLNSTQNNI